MKVNFDIFCCYFFVILSSSLTESRHNIYDIEEDVEDVSNIFDRTIDDSDDIGDAGDISFDISDFSILDMYKKQCRRSPEYRYTKLDGLITVQTIQVIINFLASNPDKIIADGLFGLRLAQGPIMYIAKHMKKSDPFYPTIVKLEKYIKKVANRLYDIVKKKGKSYDRKFLKVLDRPEYFHRGWRKANRSLVWSKRVETDPNVFNEKFSDHCIGQVLGSNKNSTRKCVFSEECMKIETLPRTQKYFLTHQILYFVSGYTHGCEKEIEKRFKSHENTDRYFDTSGANIYDEMETTKLSRIYGDNLDLFAEQGAICSMLGIVECTKRRRLYEVLNFVDGSGCVKDTYADYGLGVEKRRRKRRRDVMIDGCSQHTAATVLGYLGSYLKFMLVPPPCSMLQ